MADLLADLKQDPAFRVLSVPEQLEAARIVARRRLEKDPDYLGLDTGSRELVLDRIIANAPTFGDEKVEKDVKKVGLGYMQGSGSAEFDKNAYEFMQGMVRGSGILSGLQNLFMGYDVAKDVRSRAIDYFKALDQMQGKGSGWVGFGEFVGTAAEMAAISLVLSPASAGVARGAQAALRGGKLAAAALEAAPKIHPMMEMLGVVGADAVVTAAPLYLADELKRASNGERSIISEGGGAVLRTLGVNAAENFIWGAITGGALVTVARFGVKLFSLKPLEQAKLLKQGIEESDIQVKNYLATRDPVLLSKMTPLQKARTTQYADVLDFIDKKIADPEAYQFAQAQYLAMGTGKVLEKTETNAYRIWEFGKKTGDVSTRNYTDFNDAKNYLAHSTYQMYLKLDPQRQSQYSDPISQWAIKRGEILNTQDSLLRSSKAAASDEDLKNLIQSGAKVKTPKERIVVTRGEAAGLGGITPYDGAVVQTKLPFQEGVSKNIKEGEFNIFKGQGTARVTPHDDPNIVLFGTKGATPEEYVLAAQKAQDVIKNNPELSLESARASLLLDNGRDYFIHPDGSIEFFTLRNGKLLGDANDVLQAVSSRARASGRSRATAYVEATGRVSLGADEFAGSRKLVLEAAKQAIAKNDPDAFRDFTKLYLKGKGIEGNVTVERIPNELLGEGSVITRNPDGTFHIGLPNVDDLNLKEIKSYIKQLFDDLRTVSEISASPGSTIRVSERVASRAAGNVVLGRSRPDVSILPEGTIRELLTGLGVKRVDLRGSSFLDGGTVHFPSGAFEFKSAEELMTLLKVHYADPSLLKSFLKMQGMSIRIGKSGALLLDSQSGKILSRGRTLQEAILGLTDAGDIPLPLSGLGKSSIAFGADGVQLTLNGVSYVRSMKDTGDILKQFQDTNLLARQSWMRASKNAVLSVDPNVNYRVYLKKYDYVKNFDNVGDATRFFSQEYPKLDELKEIAEKKFCDFRIEDNRFKITDADGRTQYANTQEELADILKSHPDLEEHAPNILDAIDPTIERDVAELVQMQKKTFMLKAGRNKFNQPPQIQLDPLAKKMGAWDVFTRSTSQFTSWMRNVTNRTNRPELLKIFYEFQNARRLTQIQAYQGDKIIEGIFKVDGKMLSLADRQKIFYHLSRQNSNVAAKALDVQSTKKLGQVFDVLEPNLVPVAAKVDEFLTQLSRKFGIKMQDLIFKYMPMIRDFNVPENIGLVNKLDLPENLANAVFKGNVPREIKFWAKYERTNDIFAYTVKDDPLELLMLYNTQGHKKFYLDEPWDKMFRYLENDVASDKSLKTRLILWREQVMGYYHSPGEKVVEDFGAAFMRSLKHVPLLKSALSNVSEETLNGYGKHILKNMMSLNYIVQLGLKPWTAIRNSMQVLTTLAPRFGLAETMQAMEKVSKSGPELFQYLHQVGIISDALPIIDEIASGQTMLGKVTNKAMQWLKNGDDFSRATAFLVATEKFDNGMKYLSQNPADFAGFKRLSGLSVMDPQTGNIIGDMIKNGDIQGAKDTFASFVVKDTAFANDPSEASMLRSGLIGKLFGQYGSYAESYRANVFAMLKYGSRAERVKMVGTYLGICGAMTAAMAALNIKTNDFVPMGPGVFTGGPGFKLALNVIQTPQMILDAATDQWNVNDATTLNELKFQAGGFVPLAYQARYFQKSAEYFAAGDSWRGWLSLTGIPSTEQ